VLAGDAETVVVVSRAAAESDRERLRAAGATIVVAGDEQTALPAATTALADHGTD
jgi:hypothetical protein